MKPSPFRTFSLIFGFAFLYAPILLMVVLSFNDSRLVTVWGGFSLRWYAELLNDAPILSAFWLSLQIALLTATASVILGTFAAYVLTYYRRFFARTTFSGAVSAPLVMPEVIIGLALLLSLVWMQRAIDWPERGLITIWMGHTLVGMAYCTVVIQARLQDMDRSLAEAAQDLGCTPLKVFFLVTLPLLSQALISAWLLTFTISLDDVVISAFLSGPGSNPLPIVILSRARLGLDPTVNVIATITVVLVGIAVTISGILMARQERRRRAEMAAALRGGAGS